MGSKDKNASWPNISWQNSENTVISLQPQSRTSTPSLTTRLWSCEKQIVGVGSKTGRLKQSQCTFPRFVIGLVLPLLLPTRTICISLDHKRIVSDEVVSRIRTMFSLHHKLYACDYNSDSVVVSENQPLHSSFFLKQGYVFFSSM